MAVLVGRKIRVSEVIKSAESQGCEVRLSKGQHVTPHGTRHIRFLHNPQNHGRIDITDYDDDDFMLESEISAVERRLGITLP
jgi:hypothetical protein